MSSLLSCEHSQRGQTIRERDDWNGLDFLEVNEAQTSLRVYFLGKAPQGIKKQNLSIEGGRTERDHVVITSIDVQPAEQAYYDDVLLVHVDKPGDYSTYTLRLTGLERIDPRYASLEFSFKAGCPSDLDCASDCGCETGVVNEPVIDYLAKDYAGFRQLILDRLALISPDWRDRHVPDLGIALVELLAYIGDYLSYYQDAVATEAYLDTARRRPSVRRHARLVDYRLSEGCNARALVTVEVLNDLQLQAVELYFITGVNHLLPVGDQAAFLEREIGALTPGQYEVFEPAGSRTELRLWTAHNELHFYTWGDRECCLRKGAARATLCGELAGTEPDGDDPAPDDDYSNGENGNAGSDENDKPKIRLSPGDLLIFEEVLGPVTGLKADADPNHRQAVRLTAVTQAWDELLDKPVIEIEWAEEDALTFDLCISSMGRAPECAYLENVSVARGNVVITDHGRRTGPEDLGEPPVKETLQCCECEGQPSEIQRLPGRYRPRLKEEPLTFAAPIRDDAPATQLLMPAPTDALPAIDLTSTDENGVSAKWETRYDLLASSAEDRHFVVEMDEDGVANLRFGDGELGRQAPAGAQFSARYRTGNGPSGNVGAGAISVLIHQSSVLKNDIASVRNPLPAQGGAAPQPMKEAKLLAPEAFRYGPDALRRAITADDYARIAERHPKLQRAAARLAWSGSWYEAVVGIDPLGAYLSQSERIVAEVQSYLEGFRRIGHDLGVKQAAYVPLDIALKVCIAPEYLRGQVKAALLDAFGNRAKAGGQRGFFHADRLTFGSDIYLSELVATAHSVPGIVSVDIARLHRQFEAPNQELQRGVLPLGPFEIAQLENNPNYPDRGRLEITLAGGR